MEGKGRVGREREEGGQYTSPWRRREGRESGGGGSGEGDDGFVWARVQIVPYVRLMVNAWYGNSGVPNGTSSPLPAPDPHIPSIALAIPLTMPLTVPLTYCIPCRVLSRLRYRPSYHALVAVLLPPFLAPYDTDHD